MVQLWSDFEASPSELDERVQLLVAALLAQVSVAEALFLGGHLGLLDLFLCLGQSLRNLSGSPANLVKSELLLGQRAPRAWLAVEREAPNARGDDSGEVDATQVAVKDPAYR